MLLGKPLLPHVLWPAVDEEHVEVYTKLGSSIGLISIIPVPGGGITHYALIAYDASDRVKETDWDYSLSTSSWSGVTLYAGDYGYYTGTNTVFPSEDNGGKADKKWEKYLEYEPYYQTWGRERSERDRNFWRNNSMDSLCSAVEIGHPVAMAELGHYFWSGSYQFLMNGMYGYYPRQLWREFDKDDIKACLWYSVANENMLPQWCREALTEDERIRVEDLLKDWELNQCRNQLAPYMCGSLWWGGICK